MNHYIKLRLWLEHAPHAKPITTSVVLSFETEEEASAFQVSVNHTTGIPFACDYGTDGDGFLNNLTAWEKLKIIPVKLNYKRRG